MKAIGLFENHTTKSTYITQIACIWKCFAHKLVVSVISGAQNLTAQSWHVHIPLCRISDWKDWNRGKSLAQPHQIYQNVATFLRTLKIPIWKCDCHRLAQGCTSQMLVSRGWPRMIKTICYYFSRQWVAQEEIWIKCCLSVLKFLMV